MLADKKNNSDLVRRFKFYGFGFLLGILAVSVIYKGKGCKMPASVKVEELSSQKLDIPSVADCKMKCNDVSVEDIKKVLSTGKINYDKSNVHEKPFGTYAVEGNTTSGKSLRVMVADRDTISSVITVEDMASTMDTCKCK